MILVPPGQQPSVPADGQKPLHVITRSRFAASVGSAAALVFHLRRGAAGLGAFEAQVKRLFGNHVQIEPGTDDSKAAAAAQRGTSLQALALLLFGIIVAAAMLVIVAQSVARRTYITSDDFAALRALGLSAGQLFLVALAPAALVAAGGMALAVPIAYGLSALTPIGLARRAEVSPGLSFNAAIVLGGAALLTLLLAGRAAITAPRVMNIPASMSAARTTRRGSRIARWMPGAGFPPTAVAGTRLAFEPGRDRTAVPVRSAIFGMTVALAAVIAALVFASSLGHVINDPVVAGWNWDVAVGNPHSDDLGAQIEPGLHKDPDVAGFSATAVLDGLLPLDGRPVPIVGLQPVTGDVAPPVLAGGSAHARRDRPGRPGSAGAGQGHRRPHHGARRPRPGHASYRRAGHLVAGDHERAGPARQRRSDDARRRAGTEQHAPGPQRVPRPVARARARRPSPA